MSGRLNGKVALITGAGSGIGAGTARRFSAEGAKLFLTDINEPSVKAIAEELRAEWMVQDVSDSAGWTQVMAAIKASFGRLDVLMNNAGIFLPASIEDLTDDDLDRTLAVNTRGPILGCRAAIKLMKENPGGAVGSIINVSSIAAMQATSTAAVYAASKGAVRSVTKAVAVHCARAGYNIRCNSLHPGAIETPMVTGTFEGLPQSNAIKQAIANLQPIPRLGTPADMAAMVVFLASDESEFATGAEFTVDGGALAGLPEL